MSKGSLHVNGCGDGGMRWVAMLTQAACRSSQVWSQDLSGTDDTFSHARVTVRGVAEISWGCLAG